MDKEVYYDCTAELIGTDDRSGFHQHEFDTCRSRSQGYWGLLS